MSVVTEVGDQLFAFFKSVIPIPVKQTKKRAASSLKNLEKSLESFYAEARRQRDQHHLGLIRRARVAFYLQQHLLAAGYPSDLVRQVLFAMLLTAFVG
jgi:hypothetical protein